MKPNGVNAPQVKTLVTLGVAADGRLCTMTELDSRQALNLLLLAVEDARERVYREPVEKPLVVVPRPRLG